MNESHDSQLSIIGTVLGVPKLVDKAAMTVVRYLIRDGCMNRLIRHIFIPVTVGEWMHSY
jgi:hypothetical protein